MFKRFLKGVQVSGDMSGFSYSGGGEINCLHLLTKPFIQYLLLILFLSLCVIVFVLSSSSCLTALSAPEDSGNGRSLQCWKV